MDQRAESHGDGNPVAVGAAAVLTQLHQVSVAATVVEVVGVLPVLATQAAPVLSL